jgi:hypothetical protein
MTRCLKRVQAGEDRRPARRAERRGDNGILEMDTIGGHGVHVRRLQEGMPHEAHGVVAVIVAEDEDDVPWLGVGDALDLKVLGRGWKQGR